jgi:hypothetical protein
MMFWLVLKLKISYRSYDILKDFGFLVENFFEEYIFLHGEIFEFSSFFVCNKILVYCKWEGDSVTHLLVFIYFSRLNGQSQPQGTYRKQ